MSACANLFLIQKVKLIKNNEEILENLSEALGIVQRLRLFSITQCPQLR